MAVADRKNEGGKEKKAPSRLMKTADFRARGISKIHVALDAELHRQAKIYAATYGTTLQALVVEGLELRIKK